MSLQSLLRDKRVLVLCGAGGVGKTTTAAALGVAAARAGRKVLVLTIDPARRLAEAMGLKEGGAEPTPISPERLYAGGTPGTGQLDVWMLDPRIVFERFVHRLSPTPEAARTILDNRLYRFLSDLVAGMQEYAAAEALDHFLDEGKYDRWCSTRPRAATRWTSWRPRGGWRASWMIASCRSSCRRRRGAGGGCGARRRSCSATCWGASSARASPRRCAPSWGPSAGCSPASGCARTGCASGCRRRTRPSCW
ncbi:ArsA family ATPase [Cystobacter fuscus]